MVYIIQAFFLFFDTNYRQTLDFLTYGISSATSHKLNLKVRNLQRKCKPNLLKPGCIAKWKYLTFTLLLFFLNFFIIKVFFSFIAERTNESEEQNGIDRTCLSNTFNPILGGVFYVCWLGGMVQNYPKSLNKGNKLISHKTFQNTSSL